MNKQQIKQQNTVIVASSVILLVLLFALAVGEYLLFASLAGVCVLFYFAVYVLAEKKAAIREQRIGYIVYAVIGTGLLLAIIHQRYGAFTVLFLCGSAAKAMFNPKQKA